MTKRIALKILLAAAALIGSVELAAQTQKRECAARAAELNLEFAYYIRRGCMFKMPEGWSSMPWKTTK